MAETLAEAVRTALRSVTDPITGRDIVESGRIEGLVARDGMVQFALQVPSLWRLGWRPRLGLDLRLRATDRRAGRAR